LRAGRGHSFSNATNTITLNVRNSKPAQPIPTALQRSASVFKGQLQLESNNLKSTLDRAFQRRLRFTVNFPFPDAAQREAIWMWIFPAKTPTQGLDYKRLSQLNIGGGNVRNIVLNAAFLAAKEGKGQPVEMEHIARAAKLEAQKIERPRSSAEIRGWL
jgi:SpoVK/Ycf46/Vps4 family AAA+-type ATPase